MKQGISEAHVVEFVDIEPEVHGKVVPQNQPG
jgi:hypothetical protein